MRRSTSTPSAPRSPSRVQTGRPVSATLVAALAAAVLGLGACSGDDPAPAADETPSATTGGPSAGTSESPSDTAGETSGETPSDTPGTDGVIPASGPLVSVATSSLHAPEGWSVDDQVSTDQAGAFGPGGGGSITLIDFAGLSDDTPLDQQYAAAAATLPAGAKVTRLADATLGSEATPAAHLSYTVAGTDLMHDVVVTQRGGQSITIDFDLEPGDLQKDPGLVAEVLASFEWV